MHPIRSDLSSGASNQRRNGNGNGNDCNAIVAGNACAGRRKSVNYQPQLSLKANGDEPIGSPAGRFSPHPNEIFLAQSGKLTIPLAKFDDSLINGCLPPPSPAPNSDCLPSDLSQAHAQTQSNFQTKIGLNTNSSGNQMQQLNLNQFQQQQQGHAQGYPLSSSNSTSSLCTNNSGSTQSQPAESSSGIHHKHGKYSLHPLHPRAMSPNSKYRLERYRDPAQKVKLIEAMNLLSPGLAPATATTQSATSTRYFMPPKMVECDAYNGYLGSTVHTPVKRYVPTPPPASDIYTDSGLGPTRTATGTATTCAATPPLSSQYVNIPYNYRAKCCHNEHIESGQAQGSYSKNAQTYNVHNVPSSSAATSSNSNPCPCPSPSPASSGSLSITFPAPGTSICPPIVSTGKNIGSCNKLRSNMESARINHPDEAESIIVIQSSALGQSEGQRQVPAQVQVQVQGQDMAGTCLHCNTTRRTTGVHQTTQTTGPISPVPLAMPMAMPVPVTSTDLAKLKHQHDQEMMAHENASATIEGSDLSSTIAFQRQQQQQQVYPVAHLANSPRLQQQQQHVMPQQQQQQQALRYSCKKRIIIYMRREVARFFGVETSTETADFALWYGRHRRLAIRRFGPLNTSSELDYNMPMPIDNRDNGNNAEAIGYHATDRPDILPAQDAQNVDMALHATGSCRWRKCYAGSDFSAGEFVERKASVAHMLMTGVSYLISMFNVRPTKNGHGRLGKRFHHRQWSRSFAPIHVHGRGVDSMDHGEDMDAECSMGIANSLAALIDDEVFFDSPCDASSTSSANEDGETNKQPPTDAVGLGLGVGVGGEGGVGVYMASERHHNGWRTSALNGGNGGNGDMHLIADAHQIHQVNHIHMSGSSGQGHSVLRTSNSTTNSSTTNRGNRIAAQLLDGVLENSRRPQTQHIKYFSVNDLDDRTDHRPFFTYWINTVQIVVLFLSIICYGIAPIGFGTEQKTGQVLVTSLSLQTVQHIEQRNLWIGPRNNDLVHMGAKFAACMRRDIKIMEVVAKTRRQERETACCIRNDDSGCVQSSQADCSIRGLYPTKSISTWKKWSPGESGPGGRISGSVCGLDPKFCDAPASIAPYEWPDDITKWPICRKTNSFSQRYRYKDHTAEHMVCEVIGHPCCTGLYGECRITTREYCDFVNGYFHEEASLCSQISCLNNVCGMFPFISVEIPDQIYRLLTSLCMHAGILHLAITLIFQYLFLADLERLIGTLRTAVVYIMSGLAGNLTSAVLVPHRPEVGPSASLCGVVSSLAALLIWIHWKNVHKPYVALFKLLLLSTVLFGIGTLPYQLNFAGLLAGVACGTFLTISLVPFATFTKYGRRKKINLIWTCILFHLFVYATLITTFYIYPSEFSTFSFVDDIFGSNGNGNSYIGATNSNIGHQNGEVSSTPRRYSQTQKPQYNYHHQSEDIIRNAFPEGNIISHIYPETQRQKNIQLWQEYTRSFRYNSNYSDRIYNNIANAIVGNKDTLASYGPGRILNMNKKNNSRISEKAVNAMQLNHKNIENMNDTNFKGL
ncbi:inactive rhomboid protein 1 isoform X1 [Drosophila virilis]|uniref:inactive rhomboid protein 1 isoform X1 n=1 Tax=Drosophila virilis TaxID=7244 RepID=UPI0013965C1E|nr:inactive rhomboid protein 1 isoform X1 [Drosophila virilis]XP_032290068.1 inactive rhomboid protein 1 isoform X1 [Drosophila virilis]